MSNLIWHTDDLREASTKKLILYFVAGSSIPYTGWNHPDIMMLSASNESWWNYTDVMRWCYVDDILAKADKAEQLQKAVDNSREKLAAFMHDVWGNWFSHQLNNSTVENLQRWGIQSNLLYSSLTETDKDKDRKFANKIIEIIKDEIKQLIEETK